MNVVKCYQNIRYVKPNGELVMKKKMEKPKQNCKGIDAHDRFFEKKYINIPSLLQNDETSSLTSFNNKLSILWWSQMICSFWSNGLGVKMRASSLNEVWKRVMAHMPSGNNSIHLDSFQSIL